MRHAPEGSQIKSATLITQPSALSAYRAISMNPGIGTSGRKWRGAEGSGFVNRDHDSVQVQGSDGDNDRLKNSDI